MLLSRRIFPIVGASMLGAMTHVFYPPRVKADVKRYSLDEKRMEELNKRDHENMVKGYIQEISRLSVISNYSTILENLPENTLFDLSYIITMYENPLKDYQKIKIRNTIQELYKKAKTEEEKKMYITILDYYKLLN